MEQLEIGVLLDQGMHFDVPKKVLRWGKPNRRFTIRQPYYGTLVYLCKEYKDLNFDSAALQADGLDEAKRLLAHNSTRVARIVAIAVLRDGWKIKLFTGLLTHYFLWRITPTMFQQLASLIIGMSALPNFIASIGSLSVEKRVTAPAPIENPENSMGSSPPMGL